MTNLSPEQPGWRRRITRERILVVVPSLLGLLLAGGLFAAVGLPMRGRLEEQRQRLAELETKRGSIPSLEVRLEESDADLVGEEQKQSVLVNLLAGRGQIRTFLALLSRESAASGVVISRYEPIAAAPPAPETTASPGQNTKADEASPAVRDPMAALGYQKSSMLLQVEGPYPGLLQFLRRMERLELLVQPSDLSLKALDTAANTPAKQEETAPPQTRLKLTLSFFDQVVKSGDGSEGQGKEPGTPAQDGSSAQQPPA